MGNVSITLVCLNAAWQPCKIVVFNRYYFQASDQVHYPKVCVVNQL